MKRVLVYFILIAAVAATLPFSPLGGCGNTETVGGATTGTGGENASGATASGSGGGSTGTSGSSGSVATSGNFTISNGFSAQSLTIGGRNRQVSLLAPAGRGSNPALVIAFHGTSGDPADWIDADAGSDPQGLEELANTNGFLIAAPRARDWGDGASDWDNHSGNDRYWETRFDATPSCGSDPSCNADLALVSQIITAAEAAYHVDPKRIYLIGFSNGGFFSELAAMALRDRISAFAEAASGLVTCGHTADCAFQSSGTSCTTILSGAPSSCTSCSGVEKPVTVPTSGRLVPGILGHNNHDDTVSVFYSCALSARMQALGYDVSTQIGTGSGHGLPDGFVGAAWSFFSSKSLP